MHIEILIPYIRFMGHKLSSKLIKDLVDFFDVVEGYSLNDLDLIKRLNALDPRLYRLEIFLIKLLITLNTNYCDLNYLWGVGCYAFEPVIVNGIE